MAIFLLIYHCSALRNAHVYCVSGKWYTNFPTRPTVAFDGSIDVAKVKKWIERDASNSEIAATMGTCTEVLLDRANMPGFWERD